MTRHTLRLFSRAGLLAYLSLAPSRADAAPLTTHPLPRPSTPAPVAVVPDAAANADRLLPDLVVAPLEPGTTRLVRGPSLDRGSPVLAVPPAGVRLDARLARVVDSALAREGVSGSMYARVAGARAVSYPIPEPASLVLLGTGAIGLLARRHLRRVAGA